MFCQSRLFPSCISPFRLTMLSVSDGRQCIAELRYKAGLFEETKCVEVLDGIFKSDTIVSEELKRKLQSAISPLENVPDREKDWHPGSEEQVLDLIHPSLYPLVYGQTRMLVDETIGLDDCVKRCGDGEVLSAPAKEGNNNAWSERFQWLPSDFEIPNGVDDVKYVHDIQVRCKVGLTVHRITSYINNLHPHYHRRLYSIIEEVVFRTIPLWNQTLTPLRAAWKLPPRMDMQDDGFEEGFKEPEQESDEDDDTYWHRFRAAMDARKIIQPEPGKFKTPDERFQEEYGGGWPEKRCQNRPVDLRKDFGKLQIIVKLANICLTPEKPNYEGGSWHVEGQLNEGMQVINGKANFV